MNGSSVATVLMLASVVIMRAHTRLHLYNFEKGIDITTHVWIDALINIADRCELAFASLKLAHFCLIQSVCAQHAHRSHYSSNSYIIQVRVPLFRLLAFINL